MKIQQSAFVVLSMFFLLVLMFTFNVAAQTSETKNLPEAPKTDYSEEYRKSRRTARLKDEFKESIKNKKSDWTLIIDKDIGYGKAYLKWELLSNKLIIPDKKLDMSVYDFETVEEAVKSFNYAKDPMWDSTGTPRIPEKGFGDEGFLKDAYGQKNQIILTFRSGNYMISLTGTKDDIFSFGKIISDTISENK